MSPSRAFLLSGGRVPDPRSVRAGDLVLDAGNTATLPSGVRVVSARDLLPFAEAEAIQIACLRFVARWHSGSEDLRPLPCSPGRVVESLALIDLGQALKHLVLLRRFACREGVRAIVADLDLPWLRAVAPVLADDPAPVDLVAPGGSGLLLRRAALGVRLVLGRGRSRDRHPGASVEARPERTGRLRVWGLANYRNRAILDTLSTAPGFSLRCFERAYENRYLPPSGAREEAPYRAAARSLAPPRERVEQAAHEAWPEIPGAHDVAFDVLLRSMRLLVPAACREAAGWGRLLAEDPPDVILSGIPWGGDLRTLALVALKERIPLLACQDGVLAEVGAGGVPVGAGALAWGPAGRAWFTRRGFPDDAVFEVGDPYLERLVSGLDREDGKALRRRLGIPPAERVILASVQNSAPHFLACDPADPVRWVRILLDAFSSIAGTCLVLKPHPRLPLVDGGRRLAHLREMAKGLAWARIVEPDEPIVGLMALSDAHVGEGDTLSLEMLACGKPAILLERQGLPSFYPDFASSGAMTVVRSARALAERLAAGLPPANPGARRTLLDRHLQSAVSPGQALLAIAGRAPSPDRARVR